MGDWRQMKYLQILWIACFFFSLNNQAFGNSAAGLQSFLEKRAQEEIKIAFLYRLRSDGTMEKYFPQAHETLLAMDVVNRFGLTNRLRASAISDFKDLHCKILKDKAQSKELLGLEAICPVRKTKSIPTKLSESLRKQVEDRLTSIGCYINQSEASCKNSKIGLAKYDVRTLLQDLSHMDDRSILSGKENTIIFDLFLATLQNRIGNKKRTLPQILNSSDLKQLETDLQAQTDALLAELKGRLLKAALSSQELKNEKYFAVALKIENFVDHVHEALEKFLLFESDNHVDSPVSMEKYCVSVTWCGQKRNEAEELVRLIHKELKRRRPDILAIVQYDWALLRMPDEENSGDADLYTSFILLANFAMAKNFEEFEAVLEKAALPVGSYRQKRKGSFGIFLNGYAGLGYLSGGNYVRISMPVGLEFSKGSIWGGSIGVFLSAFNLGYPLMDAANRAEAITWANTVAPGAFAVFGIPNLPVSLAAGVEYLQKNGAPREVYFSLYLAVDVPIFDIYLR